MKWLFPRLHKTQIDLRQTLAQLAHAEAERDRLCTALTQQRNANSRLAGDNMRLTGENRELRAELEGATKALNALVGEADLSDQRVAEGDAAVFLDGVSGVSDTSRLVLHRQCERAHNRGGHERECVICRPALHPAAVPS